MLSLSANSRVLYDGTAADARTSDWCPDVDTPAACVQQQPARITLGGRILRGPAAGRQRRTCRPPAVVPEMGQGPPGRIWKYDAFKRPRLYGSERELRPACGWGLCPVYVAGHRRGGSDHPVRVELFQQALMPGGPSRSEAGGEARTRRRPGTPTAAGPVDRVAHRPAGAHVHDGVAAAGVQAEDREPDPVEFGKRDGRGGAAVARRGRSGVPAVGVRRHAQRRFWQVAGGRGGDAVAADAGPPGGQPPEGASIQRCDMCARRDRPGHFAYYSLQVRMV
jgi:hypothetical protein